MERYAIKCNDPSHRSNGKYVSQPGPEHSYTTSPARARKFNTFSAAQEAACENECVVELLVELGMGG